jgi:hypothetical protein
MPDLLGQPQPFLVEAQPVTAKTDTMINSSNVILLICRIIPG